MLIRNITKITNDSFKKLNEDVNKVLLEDIEAVKRQYSHIPEEDFYKIIKLDPTYNENRDSVGKYGKWLLGLYKKDNPLDRPFFETIYGLLSLYNEYKNDRTKEIEKDINKFKSIEDLADAVRNVGEAELSDRQKEREMRNAYKDAKLIFSDDMWQIWIPETYEASCTLGKGTTWCTAYSGNDYYYNDYTRQGPLYVFINKQNPKEKYQLHVETYSFMNADDRPASLEDVLDTDDKLREFVEEEINPLDVDNLPEEIRNVMEAVGCTPDEARMGVEDGYYYYYPDVHSPLDLLNELEWNYGLDEIWTVWGSDDDIDYYSLGSDLDDEEWEDDEGNPISAGEYWCGDEDADYEDIGLAYADGLRLSDIYNSDRYLDYDAIGRDADDFYFTSYGCVEVLY